MIWDISKYLLRLGEILPRQRIGGFLEWSLIREVLQRYAINCVLDVGASRGHFAKSLRQIGYQGFICSFEPIPEDFRRLSAEMGDDPKWRGFEMALGSEDTKRNFHVAVSSTPMSSFLRHKDNAAKMRDIEVTVRRLDSVFGEAVTSIQEPRVFLKMDTQGYDLEVVSGAEAIMRQILGLQSEVSVDPIYDDMPHYLEALETYEGLGFHLAGLFDISRKETPATIVEMNCVMVRPEYVV